MPTLKPKVVGLRGVTPRGLGERGEPLHWRLEAAALQLPLPQRQFTTVHRLPGRFRNNLRMVSATLAHLCGTAAWSVLGPMCDVSPPLV